jgi:transcriptional regulator with XRE-family HTH domain
MASDFFMDSIVFRYPEKRKRPLSPPSFRHSERRFAQNIHMPKLDIGQIFARNVKAARDARGMNQSQLAKKSGVSNAHLSEVMSGINGITIQLLADIADALDVEPWELLADSKETKRRAMERLLGEPSSAPDMEAAPPRAKKADGKRGDSPGF